MANLTHDDLRLIEAGFPCHEVGAETQRERGASSALPPLYFLHVWWARRPLTPSRAAILASLLPADTDPDWFLRQLGIEKRVVEINGQYWTLTGKLLEKITKTENDDEVLVVDRQVLNSLQKENERRRKNLELIAKLKSDQRIFGNEAILDRWEAESQPIPEPWPREEETLPVLSKTADPAWFKQLMNLGSTFGIRVPNLYGYNRAYMSHPKKATAPKVILDPASGGGSIPFEGLRLGHNVIANELNPVATVILHGSLEFPIKFGTTFTQQIVFWGHRLLGRTNIILKPFFPAEHDIPPLELKELRNHLTHAPEFINLFLKEETTTYLYCRQVTCPHCGGEAPLLNTCWLSKEAGKQWGVRIVTDGKRRNGKVKFETYHVSGGKGPLGEDSNFATVKRGVGMCVHCKQAIEADEIKAQARGESSLGKWKDRLYCVVAIRYQPKLDKNGQPLRYKSGPLKGEIKTEKVRFFRPPNDQDLAALEKAEKYLKDNWDRWDALGLIPTEKFPKGNDMRPVIYGMTRWCDMFTPRQLVGHLTLVEELNKLKPRIIEELGHEKGKAVVTYLQFAIDKGVDYNSKQTRWIPQRCQVSGTFGRHDFSLKWTFGEMIFTGPNSGASWALSQIIDSYKGIAELCKGISNSDDIKDRLKITCGTAAHMPEIEDKTVDLVCIDPPYYNNVQYAELSDYFYVWQKRTLKDLYPGYFTRRLTNKQDEAVANPDRDGGDKNAKKTYEKMMSEIFGECRRVLKDDGLMTLMFTHKSQDAWETLTRSLIEEGWTISSAFPVESEFARSQHIMDKASAASSIFISCRKRSAKTHEPATWSGFGGTGVQDKIRHAVKDGLKEFKRLKLNPVDEMVASYGRALKVLSENWPVLDGDKEVSPLQAMLEASRVVAENQIKRITKDRLRVEELSPEAAMALTLFGIYGLNPFSYDEALNLSRSLNIRLETKPGGYLVNGRFIGINSELSARRRSIQKAEEIGYHAPLVKKGSKLRLVLPEERNPKRIANPQTEWDILQGLIISYREGDIPVARGYLTQFAGNNTGIIIDLLNVWANEVSDEVLKKEAAAILFGLK